jgi:uncharacterized protein (DUF58 family)
MPSWRALLGNLRAEVGSLLLSTAPPPDADAGPLLDEDVLRQIERLSLAELGASTDGLTGEHGGRRKTQAIEFADYRGYVPGDDFRLIDWNAYARLGELFVRTSLAQENATLTLLLDCSRSMDWGRPNKLRYAKRLAAALGAVALLHHDTVRLCAIGDGLATLGAPLHGYRALSTVVEELEELPIATTTELRRGVEAYRRVCDHRGIVMLIGDLLVPADQEEAVRYLAGAGVTAAVLHVVDAAEAAPTLGGAVQLRDHETGDVVTLTVTPRLRRRYAARFAAWSQELSAYCAAHQVRYVRVPTAVPPAELVVGALRREGLVAR